MFISVLLFGERLQIIPKPLMFFKGSLFRGRHFTPKQKIIKGVFRKHKVAVKRNIDLFEINPQITVNPNTQPKLPSAGSKVTVYYTLTNLEGGTVPQGQIVVTDSSGEILGTDTSPKITSGSIDHSTVVNWPPGENVKVSVAWYVGGKSVSDDVLVNSEQVDLEEE